MRIFFTCLLSCMIGAGLMYFYGFGLVLNDTVYRGDINSMKSHAFTLKMLQDGKINVAENFLRNAIKLDKEDLSRIPIERLSEGTKQQVDMLKGLYESLGNKQ